MTQKSFLIQKQIAIDIYLLQSFDIKENIVSILFLQTYTFLLYPNIFRTTLFLDSC